MNPETVATQTEPMRLVREAAEWRLIGLLFERPAEGWHDQVAALAGEVQDPDLRTAAEAAGDEASPGLYHTTFGPGGPARIREVAYRDDVLPGGVLAELCALYEAFAYQPSRDEPPDHLATLAGLMSYLRVKEAYALARGNDEEAAVAADAARRLIEDHLSFIAEPLSVALGASGIRYLWLAAEALHQRTGPMRPRPSAGGIVPAEEDGCP